jgi:hypothetical protein
MKPQVFAWELASGYARTQSSSPTPSTRGSPAKLGQTCTLSGHAGIDGQRTAICFAAKLLIPGQVVAVTGAVGFCMLMVEFATVVSINSRSKLSSKQQPSG